MKNIVKTLAVGAFISYMACVQPMGRAITAIGDKVRKTVISKVSREVRHLNQETTEKTIFSFGGKRATENLGKKITDQAKKGIDPSSEQLFTLDDYSLLNKHGVLNFADADGHTLLYYVLKNNPALSGYKGVLKHLKEYRGAQLNIRDKYIMGSEKVLKTLLNLPLEANAWTTVKVFRTLVTKSEKLQKRVRLGKLSGAEADLRHKKVAEAKNIYSGIESDLLAKREVERSQMKKEKYFGFNEL